MGPIKDLVRPVGSRSGAYYNSLIIIKISDILVITLMMITLK